MRYLLQTSPNHVVTGIGHLWQLAATTRWGKDSKTNCPKSAIAYRLSLSFLHLHSKCNKLISTSSKWLHLHIAEECFVRSLDSVC